MPKVYRKMTADGIDLSPYFQIKKIHRPSTADITNTVKQYGKRGAQLIEKKYGSKLIKVDIFIKEDILATIDILNSIFIREEFKIIFSDRPDKYFIVTLSDISDPSSEIRDAELTLSFLALDGHEHSITYKQVLNYTEEGNKLIFDIENNGNTEAYPIIRIENVEELGYAGVVNQTGVIEIGNINEQGTEDFKRTEYLIEYKSSDTGFEVNKGIFNDDAWALTGNIGTRSRDGRTFTKMSGINSTSGQNGASMTFTIPADSNSEIGSLYDYIRWRQAFECNFSEQGIFKIAVTDINDEFIFGVQTVKYANGQQAYYDILGRNDEGTSTVYKRFKNIKTTNRALDNPLALIRGNSDIRRVDDKITAYWDTKYYDIHMPEIKGMVSAKIHFLFGNFGTKKYPEVNYLDWFRYGKNFVVKERDIPNRYPAGSVIEINNENNTLQVDGKHQLNDVVQGSTFITLPTGTSKLEVHLSEWVVIKPKVTIEFEERWL